MSHFSAAAYWNIPYLDNRLDSMDDGTSKMDFTVSQRKGRYLKKDRITHLCKLDLPAGAVISRNGIMGASPELLFLQLAFRLDIQKLILLGLQICSHPPGNHSKAITTKQKLKAFLTKTQGNRGHRKALRAVKYIENGSASIMESVTYMFLTLPHVLGGYGLGGAVFNHEIKIKDDIAKRIDKGRCFVDLYYKLPKVAVEYDSFAFHNSPSEPSRLGKQIQIRTKKFDQMHLLSVNYCRSENRSLNLVAENPADSGKSSWFTLAGLGRQHHAF